MPRLGCSFHFWIYCATNRKTYKLYISDFEKGYFKGKCSIQNQ